MARRRTQFPRIELVQQKLFRELMDFHDDADGGTYQTGGLTEIIPAATPGRILMTTGGREEKVFVAVEYKGGRWFGWVDGRLVRRLDR